VKLAPEDPETDTEQPAAVPVVVKSEAVSSSTEAPKLSSKVLLNELVTDEAAAKLETVGNARYVIEIEPLEVARL
jgi:hypothetical protein